MSRNHRILDGYWYGWGVATSEAIAQEIRDGLYEYKIEFVSHPRCNCYGLNRIAKAIEANLNIKEVLLYVDIDQDREGYCSLLSAILNNPVIQKVEFGGFTSWNGRRISSCESEIKRDICGIFQEWKGSGVLVLSERWREDDTAIRNWREDDIETSNWDWLFPTLKQNIYREYVNIDLGGYEREVPGLEDTLRRNRMLFWSWSLENALAFTKETKNTSLTEHIKILLSVCLRFPQRPHPDCWTIVFEHARIVNWE